jgi:hypothetical protein
MVLLPRDDREPRLDLSCRRPILVGSSTSSASLVSPCAAAMQRIEAPGYLERKKYAPPYVVVCRRHTRIAADLALTPML